MKNLTPVLGTRPGSWENLPQPDCIFVGGSGREISRLVELAYKQLKTGGRLVASVGSIENLSAVHEALAAASRRRGRADDQRCPRHAAIGARAFWGA